MGAELQEKAIHRSRWGGARGGGGPDPWNQRYFNSENGFFCSSHFCNNFLGAQILTQKCLLCALHNMHAYVYVTENIRPPQYQTSSYSTAIGVDTVTSLCLKLCTISTR